MQCNVLTKRYSRNLCHVSVFEWQSDPRNSSTTEGTARGSRREARPKSAGQAFENQLRRANFAPHQDQCLVMLFFDTRQVLRHMSAKSQLSLWSLLLYLLLLFGSSCLPYEVLVEPKQCPHCETCCCKVCFHEALRTQANSRCAHLRRPILRVHFIGLSAHWATGSDFAWAGA